MLFRPSLTNTLAEHENLLNHRQKKFYNIAGVTFTKILTIILKFGWGALAAKESA